jgi:hypothetical protein
VGERPKKKKIIFSPPPSLPHSGSVDDAGERVGVEKEGDKKKKNLLPFPPPYPFSPFIFITFYYLFFFKKKKKKIIIIIKRKCGFTFIAPSSLPLKDSRIR